MLELKKKTLFVLSPHPDDEVLGCAGLIKRVKDGGGKVYVLFLTVGDADDYRKKGKSTGKERLKEIEKVAKYLEYDDYRVAFNGNKYHLQLDNLPQLELMREIENGLLSLNKLKPDIVAIPHHSDYNQDHRACSMALFGAARPVPEDTKPFQKIILGYESVPTAAWWEIDGKQLNFYLPLHDEEVQTKILALKLYRSQVRTGNHPRSLESVEKLVKFRGIEAGADSAEAFYSYRIIVTGG